MRSLTETLESSIDENRQSRFDRKMKRLDKFRKNTRTDFNDLFNVMSRMEVSPGDLLMDDEFQSRYGNIPEIEDMTKNPEDYTWKDFLNIIHRKIEKKEEEWIEDRCYDISSAVKNGAARLGDRLLGSFRQVKGNLLTKAASKIKVGDSNVLDMLTVDEIV